MADEQLNVVISTTYAGADPAEVAAFDELLKKVAADQQSAQSNAAAFAATSQQVIQNPIPFDEIKNSANDLKTVVSDVETHVNGLRRTSAALKQLGLEAFGDFVGKIAGIQQVVREFNSLTDALPGLVKGIPFVEEGLQSLTGAVGKDAANFIALSGTLGVVGLAVTALTALYNAQKQASDEARKAAIAGLDAQSQYIANINTGSKDVVQKARDDLAKQKKDAEDQIALLQSIPDALQKVVTLEGGEGITNDFVNKAFQPIKDQLVKIGAISAEAAKNADPKDLFNVINDKIKALQNTSTQAAVGIGTYDTALKSGSLTNETAAKMLETSNKDAVASIQSRAQLETKIQDELTTMTKDQAQARLAAIAADKKSTEESIATLAALPNKTQETRDALTQLRNHFSELNIESAKLNASLTILPAELKKTSDEFIKITAQLVQENQQYAQVIADRVIQDTRATALAAQQQIIDDDKKREQEKESEDKITQMRTDAASNETTQLASMYARRVQINQTAMENELKLLDDYQKNETRATQDYSTSRIRKLQDLYASLSNLAASRDVAGFVNQRASGLTDIARGDEDAGTAAQRRRQDYNDQLKAEEESRAKQLDALQVSYDTESALRATELQKKITQEQTAANVGLKDSEIAAKKLSDLQAAYAKQDIANRRRIEDDAHAQTISKLTEQQQQLGAIISGALTPAITFFGQISTAISNMFLQVSAAASAPVAASSSGGFGAGPGFGAGIARAIDNRSSSNAQVFNTTVNVAGIGSLVSHSDLELQTNNIISAVRIAHGAPA